MNNNNEVRDFVLPSAPAKTLWFEFLFMEGLLESHLSHPACDPSPAELIVQFVNHAQAAAAAAAQSNHHHLTNGSGDGLKGQSEDRKSFLLKLLAVKTGSCFNWDLDLLQQRLPLTKQLALISSLRQMCQSYSEDMGIRRFAELTYYRWCLRTLTRSSCPVRQQKGLQVPIPQLQAMDPAFTPPDVINALLSDLEKEVGSVICMLEALMLETGSTTDLMVRMPTIACFQVRRPHFDWSHALTLTTDQVKHQLRYEMGLFFFIRDPPDYERALRHFSAIPQSERHKFPFLDDGYIIAATGMCPRFDCPEQKEDTDMEPETQVTKAFERMQTNISESLNLFEALVVKHEDEVVRQIEDRLKPDKDAEIRRNARRLKAYLCAKNAGFRRRVSKHKPIDPKVEQKEDPDPGVECMEHQLLSAKTPQLVLDLSCHVNKHYADVNFRWSVPTVVRDVLRNLPDVLRNRSLIRLAKANELRNCITCPNDCSPSHHDVGVRDIYLSVMEETQTLVGPSISDLLHFEILKTDLEEHLSATDVDERDLNRKEVMVKCATALSVLSTASASAGTTMAILSEISEDLVECMCVTMLHRLHSGIEKHYNHPNPIVRLTYVLFMFAARIATSDLSDLGKYLWDTMHLLLLENSPTHPHKRVKFQQNVPPPVIAVSLLRFIGRLRSPDLQLVMAACLTKMLNDVRDNSRNEMSIPVVRISGHSVLIPWPHLTVSQTTVLPDLRTISGVLRVLTERALSRSSALTPETFQTWVRIRADLALIESEYETAIRNLLLLLSCMTQSFSSFARNKEEDLVIQRMIIVSNRLSCHTQSAVMQQMLLEPNYSLAFKSLSERSCCDSCDDLISCIWDVTLLEFLVSLNVKRGDMECKSRMIQLIGQLELNGNNSKCILRDAASVRKRKFFRILTKKYL